MRPEAGHAGARGARAGRHRAADRQLGAPAREPFEDRITAWLDESGLDGWVVQRELQDPAQYAELWMRDGGDPMPEARAELYEAWLDDFDARDVEAIELGLVTLRRPVAGEPGLDRVESVLGGL